jgi:REP element-mobilizing transposase RayT
LDAGWARDGLTRVSRRWQPDQIQISVKSRPELSPATVAARIKGRLDHALRQGGWTEGFHRRVGLRSLGYNTADTVLSYIATQLDRAELVDPRYVQLLAEAAWNNPDFDLSVPSATLRGRYWYDLHIVAVTNNRYRVNETLVAVIRQAVLQWAFDFKHSARTRVDVATPGLRSLFIMPDHLHIAARGPVELSPAQLAESLYGKLNGAAGYRLFSDKIYLGTFSVYPLGCIG